MRRAPDFDAVAWCYRGLECLVFGSGLQRSREALLEEVLEALPGKRARILMVGDGDGRLSELMLEMEPELRVDFYELSAAMMARAKSRVRGVGVRWHHASAEGAENGVYDLVVTPFVLDCYGGEERREIIGNLRRKLKAGGAWLVVDFVPPRLVPGALPRWRARILEALMVAFFRISSGVRIRRIPPVEAELAALAMPEPLKWRSKCGFLGAWLYRGVRIRDEKCR